VIDGKLKMQESLHEQASTQMLSRYFDRRFDRWVIKVLPGTQYVTCEASEMLVTTLGSCVSACIRDNRTGFTGMNHFMLPGDGNCSWGGAGFSLRFGHFAMESLLNAFFSTGSRREDLTVKLFGGGNVAEFSQSIGDHNAEFAIEYLCKEGIALAGSDLGGKFARRIHFHPDTGKVQRRFVADNEARQDAVVKEEERYRESLTAQQAQSGSVELFDPVEENSDE
jgi:chemotaxis protein CheD